MMKDEKGFSLVEIIISLGLMAIISAAIYQLYISNYKTWVSQDLVTELQQSTRFAMDTMNREMQLMGYNLPTNLPAADNKAIIEATSARFTFMSTDESLYNPSDPTSINKMTRKITFYLDGTNLKMNVYTWDKSGGSYAADTGNVLAENVTGLGFKYYDDDNIEISDVALIRRVKMTLTIQTSRKDPVTGLYKKMTLITEIRPRNLGIGETISDKTPPAVPTGLKVIDPGLCGTLRLQWTPNTEVDLAGYIIYYGQATNSYIGEVSVSSSAASSYYLSGLTTSESTGLNTVKYYIVIAAIDNAGNKSGYSTEVSGDPNANPAIRITNYRDFTSGNDTTIDIGKTTFLPTGFIGSNPADGQVKLDWIASTDTNVAGYRIYRKTSNFAAGDYPLPASMLVTNVGSRTLTTYTDSSASLEGCQVYYYAITPVTCDETLIADNTGSDPVSKKYTSGDYVITYGDGVGSGADVPSLPTPSDTAPGDHTVPGTPVISKRPDGTIVSGYKRAYLTVTNPADADFSHTLVYYNNSLTTPPTVDENPASPTYGVISGGNPVPDSNVGIKGRLEGSGSISFVHDSETGAAVESVTAMHAPTLTGQQYRYLAVAYDRCGNPKADTAAATTLATLCGDGDCDGGTADAEYGPPDAPTGASVSGCNNSSMTVAWNAIIASATQNPDAAGYRIYRSPSPAFPTATARPEDFDTTSCLSSPGTTCNLGFVAIGSGTTWTDSSDLHGLTDGGVYSYGIVSTDCTYENRWIPSGEAAYKFNNSWYPKLNPNCGNITPQGWLYYNGATSTGVTPGVIDRDDQAGGHPEVLTRHIKTDGSTGDPVTSTNGYHNAVKLYFRNTSQGTMTITGLSDLRWSKSTARLAKVSIGGNSSGGKGNEFDSPVPLTSVWSAASAAELKSSPANITLAGGFRRQVRASDLHVPIILEFRDVNNAVNDFANMRGDDLYITLNVTNDSTGTTSCASYLTESQENVAISVPLGPTFDNDVPLDGSDIDDISVMGTSESAGRSPAMISPGGTVSGAVPEVAKNDDIEVFAYIKRQDGSAVISSSRKIYWKETADTETTPPASFPNIVDMSLESGNQYKGTIPANKGKRVWFYMVAYDDRDGLDGTTNDRNFDRSPEVQDGYYAYDQIGDPCSDVPDVPSAVSLTNTNSGIDVVGSGSTTGTGAAGSVTLTWTPPSTNTDGTALHDLGGYKIYESKSSDKGVTWNNYTKKSTDPNSSASFSYVPAATDPNGTWYRYCVVAYDTCTSIKENPVSDTVSDGSVSGSQFCMDDRDDLPKQKEKVIKGSCSAVPAIPAGLTVAYSSATGQVNLSWTANADYDLAGYNVYVSTDDGSTWSASPINASLITGTTYNYSPSNPNGTHLYYSVAAKDLCNLEGTKSVKRGPVKIGTQYNFDDNTLQGWTVTGTTNATVDFRVVNGDLHLGITAGTSFDVPAVTVRGSVDMPAKLLGATPTLSFDYILDGECGVGVVCTYDRLSVQISNNGGATFTSLTGTDAFLVPISLPDTGVNYVAKTYDLAAYAGQTVIVRFSFDSRDSALNNYPGVYITNVDLN